MWYPVAILADTPRTPGTPPRRSMQPYEVPLEKSMKALYDSLSEKDRRRYAGIEALKLGQGGRNYIAQVLGCSRRTVTKGAKEISGLPGREVDHRIREPGAGRKPYMMQWAEIDQKFLAVLHDHTAGDPMNEQVRWTNLTMGEIGQALHDDHGIAVSKQVVRQLLRKHHYRRRQAQKKIQRLRADYAAAGDPKGSLRSAGGFPLIDALSGLSHLLTRYGRTYDHDF